MSRPWDEIVDGAEKRRVLLEVAKLIGIAQERAMLSISQGGMDRALALLES
jgi:phosphoserine phosphatase